MKPSTWNQNLWTFFKLATPPDTARKVYTSVVNDDKADMASVLESEEPDIESGEDTADDQPGGCGLPGSGAGSSNDHEHASHAPAAGGVHARALAPAAGGMREREKRFCFTVEGMHEPAKDWVLVKKKGRPLPQIVEQSVWKKEAMSRMTPYTWESFVHVWPGFRG